MRHPQKSQLALTIVKGLQPSPQIAQAKYVLDGGALLHRVKWQKKVTYKDIVMQYVKCVRLRYGDCCIVFVFDGYEHDGYEYDHEHQRRVGKTCADVQFDDCLKAHTVSSSVC